MKKTVNRSSTFSARLKSRIDGLLERMAETLDSCEWYPCSRQMRPSPCRPSETDVRAENK